MEPITLSRRERERRMRQRLMLDAARQVFAEKGYRTATLDEIAQRAEFGKGTLYNYFPKGKEELFFAIFDDLHEDFAAIIRRHFGMPGPAQSIQDRILGLFSDALAYLHENGDLLLIMLKESDRILFGDDPDHARRLHRHDAEMTGLMVPALEDAIARGEVRAMPLLPAAHMILSQIEGYMRFHVICRHHLSNGTFDELPPGAPPSMEDAVQFLTDFVCFGLHSPAGSPVSTSSP
ncbi:MAG: TetR/AcrR family transcriptional regulator [Bacteroidota bacterium]